jgi:molybdenum cofactor biosynthesis MoaF-like protein
MKANPLPDKTMQWTFSTGPMARRTFEHTFEEDGTVTFREVTSDGKGKPTRAEKSEFATVGKDVYAVSYLASSGYTLTVVLDYRTGHLVAFASNEKELVVQEGTFEAAEKEARAMVKPEQREGWEPPC